MQRMTRRGWYAWLWTVVVLGYGTAAMPQYFRAMASARWPVAEGVVVKSQVKQVSRRGGVSHRADVAYEYVVAGQRYVGTMVAWVPAKGHVDHVQPVLNTYPVGRKVSVYYDPSQPGECLLEPGLHHEQKAAWVLGSVAVVIVYGMGLLVICYPGVWRVLAVR